MGGKRLVRIAAAISLLALLDRLRRRGAYSL